jgi:hypothetical protein
VTADEVSPEARERLDRELTSIGRGNPGTVRMLRQSLERLAGGAGGADLKEAAKEILAGRIGVRRALTGNISGRSLQAGLRDFQKHYQRLPPEERARLRESGRDQIRRLADEERRTRRPPGEERRTRRPPGEERRTR